jgi:hypothetical protein
LKKAVEKCESSSLLDCIIVSIRLRTHKIKETRHLILVIVKIGYQMDIIDLEDGMKDAKILTL